MRYENWDVLLFPDQSRIPIQEFDLRCQVVHQVQDEVTGTCFPSDVASSKSQPRPGQLPTLTAFICSLSKGTPFRVSVHSWQTPVPSDLLLNFKTAQEKVAYEVRVYIDGTLTALRHVGDCTGWPEVIGKINLRDRLAFAHAIDSQSSRRDLRFPPFHREVLSQKYWKPDDGRGRIRIVIAEGVVDVTSQTQGGQNRSFDRLRDILAFSFQHAPLSVLEHAGIAWPNPRMFSGNDLTDAGASRKSVDTHAHSPQRPPPPMSIRLRNATNNTTKPVFELPSISIRGSGTALSTGEEPTAIQSELLKPDLRYSSGTDVTMSDAHSAGRVSEMSGVVMQAPDFEQHLDQAAVDEIVRALSPSKKQALLDALASPGISLLSKDGAEGTTPSTERSRSGSVQNLRPSLQARMAATQRDSSSRRRVSTSNVSSESLDDTPTLCDTWSNSELSHFAERPTFAERDRSGSVTSKRKRNVSPQPLQADDGDMLLRNVKGMSTSPSKQSPTPIKAKPMATTEESEVRDI